MKKNNKTIFKFFVSIPRLLMIGLIKVYQKTLSPDHGFFSVLYPYGYCRHYPTCSEYWTQALGKHGIFKGSYFGIKRLFRCTPFHKCSIDKVPK